MSGIRVTSEIGRLERVLCHTPGPELLAVTPTTREDYLYDDIIDLEEARREHDRFTSILGRFGEVLQVRDLLEDLVDIAEVRPFLLERVMDVAQSEPLARELNELPAAELVSLFVEGRKAEEGPIQSVLKRSSYDLPPLPNLYFTRDAGMVVGGGVLIGSMRYAARWTEEILMKALFRFHPSLAGAPLVYDGSEERRVGYTLEGGDVHVLRPDLVVMGLSQRSSPGAFDIIAERLIRDLGVRDVVVVVLPSDRAMIHLDMIWTMVDHEHCVVYPPSFVGPDRCAVLHYSAGKGVQEMSDLFATLRELDLPLEPVFCGGGDRIMQEREQWSSGCNFVAVRPGVVLGYTRNERTFRELEREAGYRTVDAEAFLAGADVADGEKVIIAFEGGELVRGGGGSRCMTLPVQRGEAW